MSITEVSEISIDDIKIALNQIRNYFPPTPLLFKDSLGIKLETILPSRSFKIRGTINAITNSIRRNPSVKEFITVSTGNHGIGLAYASKLLGVSAYIVVPINVSKQKTDLIESYGGQVIFNGQDFDEAEKYARHLEQKEMYTYISSYETPDVIAGQGTIGLEIIEQYPQTTMIVVPVGGGGLLGGIALACSNQSPHTKVIGVQSKSTPAMYNSIYGTDLPQQLSLADGLAGGVARNSLGLKLCKKYVHQVFLVEEDEIKEAMRWGITELGFTIEGSSACTIAAIDKYHWDTSKENIVAIASGGNVPIETLTKLFC